MGNSTNQPGVWCLPPDCISKRCCVPGSGFGLHFHILQSRGIEQLAKILENPRDNLASSRKEGFGSFLWSQFRKSINAPPQADLSTTTTSLQRRTKLRLRPWDKRKAKFMMNLHKSWQTVMRYSVNSKKTSPRNTMKGKSCLQLRKRCIKTSIITSRTTNMSWQKGTALVSLKSKWILYAVDVVIFFWFISLIFFNFPRITLDK